MPFFAYYPPNGAVSTGGSTVTVSPNTNASYAAITNLSNVAQTFTPPANAVGFILESASTNTVNIRWQMGGAATAAAGGGMLAEPGRDSGYVPCNKAISVIAVSASGSTEVGVQWILSS